MNTLSLKVDADGIALVTLDDPTKAMNVVSQQLIAELCAVIEQVATDPEIKGAVITSAKPAFMAGADLKQILPMSGGAITLEDAYAFSQKASMAMHRRMETCGKPFVAALNGLALGGGYELALACHHRILVDNPKALVGLPEVTVGLLPGSGGTQRLPRMIGVDRALPLLLEGRTVGPAEALKLGLVDAVVAAGELIPAARQWALQNPAAQRPWDHKAYRNNGGLLNASLAGLYATWPARLVAQHQYNYPAPIATLACVFEGTLMPMDKALRLESKHFATLLCGAVARNIIRTTFVNKGEAGKLAWRNRDVPKSTVTKLGVLGAGMMGAGISYVAAVAGIAVVLLDSTPEQAEGGKAYSAKLLDKDLQRGKKTAAQVQQVLARIVPTVDYAMLAGCELVVEAVFEDAQVKADVTRRAEAVLGPQAIFASNTSTLPIGELARASTRPGQFIGLHFFSPVDRMPLVEVIVAKGTSEVTLAKSLDFVAQLRMTPIVVNDSRGFYTSRVFQTFIHEGMRMVEEGIAPALVENAARLAGFPIGPLALLDEVTISLPWKIVMQAREALGDAFVRPCAYNVMQRMLEEFQRPGRRAGGGFFDYPKGEAKRLWSGLAQAFPPAAQQPALEGVKQRFLYIQALETARCFEEGVVTRAADADVGSVLAWGYPRWTGGTLSFIDTVGIAVFVRECARMAESYGPRYTPSDWLRGRAELGVAFYPTPEAVAAAVS